MDRKSFDSVNQRRKKLCAHHKVFQNKCEETEFRMKHDYFRIYCVMPRSFEKCK